MIGCRREVAAPQPPPDIILVTIDTLRADSVGFSGNSNVKTPFLDRLAREGVVYTNAHAHNVVTLPSHVNILTGLYPFQHGVRDNAGFVVELRFRNVAERLRERGYATGAFIAAFPLDSRFGLNRGFDLYDDNYGKGETRQQFVVQERAAPAVLKAARAWFDSQGDRRRFLWIHLYDPHAPYAPPEPYASEFRRNPYLGEISFVDSALAESLGPMLERRPNTLLIVTGDHGEALGEHGELTHGLFAYQASLHVPLLVREPGVLAPRRESESVRHVDIAPTILERAGIPLDAALPGRSLLQAIESRDTYFEALSGSVNRGWAPLTGIIHAGKKYIDLPLAELYDLPSDPRELNNLLDAQRRDVIRARQLLRQLTASTAVSPRRNVSSEESARLLSLGYISGNAIDAVSFRPEDDPKNLVGIDGKMHEAIDAYGRGELRQAVAIARDVVKERPSMVGGRVLLAFMLEQSGRSAEAIEHLQELVRTGRASKEAKVQLALVLSENGRAGEAVGLIAPIAAGDSDPDVRLTYGIALADVGRTADAVRQFEEVLANDPNNAPALQNLGIVALREGNMSGAEQYLRRALELNPKLPLALNTLGVVHARKGDLVRAVELWNIAVDLDPRQYDALFNIGLVSARSGNRQEARRALRRFVETAPPLYARDVKAAREALAALEKTE